MQALFDDFEPREQTADEPPAQSLDREWRPGLDQMRNERPPVERFDPYFGRSRRERAIDPERPW